MNAFRAAASGAFVAVLVGCGIALVWGAHPFAVLAGFAAGGVTAFVLARAGAGASKPRTPVDRDAPPLAAASPGRFRVYAFHRGGDDPAVPVDVFLDDAHRARLRPREYVTFEAAPGAHAIEARAAPSPETASFTAGAAAFDAEDGGVETFVVLVARGWFGNGVEIEPEDHVRAAGEMRDMTAVAPAD